MSEIRSSTPKIRIETAGGVATVLIDNAPRRNAFDYSMWSALPDVMRQLDAEEGVRVAVLRAAPSLPFCSGADISEFDQVRDNAQGAAIYDASLDRFWKALSDHPKPTIAMASSRHPMEKRCRFSSTARSIWIAPTAKPAATACAAMARAECPKPAMRFAAGKFRVKRGCC